MGRSENTGKDNNLIDQEFFVRLNRLDMGQVIEGLSCRQEEWQQTADWHTGKNADFPDHFKECSNAEEAQWIADNYRRILALIEKQFRAQS